MFSHKSALLQLQKSIIVHVDNVTLKKQNKKTPKNRELKRVFFAGEALVSLQHLAFFKYNNTVFLLCNSLLYVFCFNKEFHTLYSIPNPLAWVMAFSSRSFSFSLDEYSGSSSVLKQVWDVGSLGGTIDTKCDWTPLPEMRLTAARCSEGRFNSSLVPVRVRAVLDDHHVELLESANRRPVCASGELEEQPFLILPEWVDRFPEIPADRT